MNKMKRQLHRLLALLLGCVLFCCPVFAAEECSLRVHIVDEQRDAVPYFNVEIVPVTTFDGSTHTLLSDFAALGITADALRGKTADQAERVYQYIHANDILGKVRFTDTYGVANFGTLDRGIYLVFDRGDQDYTFPPYLVELPTQTDEGLIYHLNSEPKTVSAESHRIVVSIVWLGDENALDKRPYAVEIALMRDTAPENGITTAAATIHSTTVLNAACRWKHTFHSLPRGGTYFVEAPTVAQYTYLGTFEVSEGFILFYQYTPTENPDDPSKPPVDPDDPDNPPDDPDDPSDPSDPDTPPVKPPVDPSWPILPWPDVPDTPVEGGETLPQTGFRMLPVYALLIVGSVLVVLGMADLCVKKREEP